MIKQSQKKKEVTAVLESTFLMLLVFNGREQKHTHTHTLGVCVAVVKYIFVYAHFSIQ